MNQTQSSNRKVSDLIRPLILILIAIALFATNPTEVQFKEFLKTNFKAEAQKEGGLTGAIMELFSGTSSWVADLSTERKSYILFSVYNKNISGEERTYVGILNNFIEF